MSAQHTHTKRAGYVFFFALPPIAAAPLPPAPAAAPAAGFFFAGGGGVSPFINPCERARARQLPRVSATILQTASSRTRTRLDDPHGAALAHLVLHLLQLLRSSHRRPVRHSKQHS